ncbi:hypothetical protein SLE2022_163070 [Rubroshorea leprosula]
MNVVLDSPLEALPFNYVSFGILAFVINLWPLVAVITAALSFWRIRAAAGISNPVKKLLCEDHDTSSPPPPPSCVGHVEELSAVKEEPLTSWSWPGPDVTFPLECCDGVTKGRKFVLYYEDDEGDMMAAEEEEDECSDQSGNGGTEEWWGSWEGVLTTRRGEMEWYRYQDLTVINGNVVRLWGKCGGGILGEGAAQE